MKSSKNIDLIDIATIFAKNKKQIISVVSVATVLGVLIAFAWPKSYESDVTFIVTDGNSINFSGSGLLSGLANFSTGGGNLSADQVLVLIRSKDIQDKVIKKFNLQELFNTDIPEALRKKLDNRIEVEEKREGGLGFNSIISTSIAYTDEDPERTFDVLNYYYEQVQLKVEDLNRKNIEGGYQLLKARLEQNEKELKTAEDSLVAFQTKYGILEVEEQAKSQIKNVAELKTQIVKLEVEIGYLQQVLGENNKQIENLKLQKDEFEKKYDEYTTGNGLEILDTELFQPIKKLPNLFIKYLRLYREVVVQEEVFKVLYPQFEQQRLNYNEVNSGLMIIEPPVLPTYKIAPKRSFIIIAFVLFGMFFAMTLVLVKEWFQNLKEDSAEDYQKVITLRESLIKWR